MNMTTLSGQYNECGYSILDERGAVLYTAGNHRQDSQAYVEPTSPSACSLETLRKFCIQTGEEMAQEKRAVWSGAEYEPQDPQTSLEAGLNEI